MARHDGRCVVVAAHDKHRDVSILQALELSRQKQKRRCAPNFPVI